MTKLKRQASAPMTAKIISEMSNTLETALASVNGRETAKACQSAGENGRHIIGDIERPSWHGAGSNRAVMAALAKLAYGQKRQPGRKVIM